ncbi:hypothetical protein V8F33_011945 [Rhypophila sp. PSN 637]
MAAQLAIQRCRGQSEPTSLCSFPSNSSSPPGEAGHSKNVQISNLVANYTKSPSPPHYIGLRKQRSCQDFQACRLGKSKFQGDSAKIRERVGPKPIRSKANQIQTAVTRLIRERFQVLRRLPLARGFDIGKQGCPSPARSSRSDEHAKAKDTAGKTNQPPKSPRPQLVVIDLTGNPEDHEPAHSLSPLQSTKLPGNKRKRTDAASDLNAP